MSGVRWKRAVPGQFKTWRVRLAGGGCLDFCSQDAAYQAVAAVTDALCQPVEVLRAVNGRWVLHEQVEPAG